ncbi:MAG: Tim44/TimA family putative adaptor protein [Sphingomonas sp.]
MFYVVLLAMIAGFAALRLYMVLGKRTGHEQPLPKPAEDRLPAPALPRPIEAALETRDVAPRHMEQAAESGIRAIIAADAQFNLPTFIDGAKSAYRMILEAFWKGDEETLGWLADDEVRSAFAQAIADRTAAGQTLDNKLLSIERATVVDASLAGKQARISVRIDADISSITRDAEGMVIAGSLSDAIETQEIWTFARTLKSGDPNWKLVETDEA